MRRAWSAISRGVGGRLLVAACALGLGSGCGIARPDPEGGAACATFEEGIKPILDGQCAQCHSAARAEADYRTDTWFRTVRRRDDGSAPLVPGERDSAFLKAVRGELPGHTALQRTEMVALEDWAVRCRADPRALRVHEHGWMTPTDSNFHGQALRRTAYDFSGCHGCHGEDLRGGSSGVNCESCHQTGVLGCNTCHGTTASAAPPRDLSGARSTASLGVGAHQTHLRDGPLHKGYACTVCHLVPSHAEAEGHYRGPGEPDFIAELTLRPSPGLEVTWERGTATCGNGYCHAPKGPDAAATNQAPVWTAGADQAACGSCHGIPPAGHPGSECELCHGPGYSATTVNLDLHANGTVDFGGAAAACNTCHGSAANPAPPIDLQGRTDPSLPTVGAHQAHLNANRLSSPIACGECHLVPSKVNDPGHLDSALPAEVFPLGSGPLARARGATPTYSHQNATCSSVYCHGGGTAAQADQGLEIVREWRWANGADQLGCGTCHGIPPVDANHHASILLNQCHTCHAATIDTTGNLIFTTDGDGVRRTTHLDGTVQKN
jgi:predicted CxxxxCH...CXXCH cytochrome family protein